MSLERATRVGHYEITAKLGEGGMGEVYRAHDRKLGRDVAIKVLPATFAADAERLARFEREAKLLASLNHPHIAAIYGVEDSGGVHALVMELVEGPTLAERIAEGPLPIPETLAIARQVAEALEAAHERGVVHRDLKPANVKLSSDGRVKVLDFGLAKAFDPVTSADPGASPTITAMATQHGVILGTAAYMSPEQARGQAVDKRSDIWAFGCLVYEMLTSKRAFDGETVSDTLAAILRGEVDWNALPANTPLALRRLLAHCLEKDRRKRLHDIGDARFELEEAATEGAIPLAARAGAPARQRPWAVLAVTAAVLALGAGYLLARWLAPAPSPARGTLRLLLPAPEGMTFHDVPVISPDGRKVAFVARTAAERLAVYVSGLDGVATPPLAEINPSLDPTGSRPFWAPDSRAIGFCDGDKLRVADLAGSALRTLADCERTYRGGDWGADDTIVFAPSSNSALFAVPAAGGEAKAATPFDNKIPDLSHRFPHFLPGGRRFLYLAWSNAADVAEESVGIFVGDLKTGASRRLSDVRTNAALVGDGRHARLLLHRERGLVALDFDSEALTLGGGEVLVERELQWFANGGYAYFSANASGDVLILPPQGQQVSILNMIDRHGTDQSQVSVPAIYVDYTVSPDARQVAAAVFDAERGVSDIWVIDLARQVSTRLTQGRGSHFDPVWHPDGRTIGFTTEEVTGMAQPFAVAADGSAPPRRLAETGKRDTLSAFSPDGEWLLLTRDQEAGSAGQHIQRGGIATKPVEIWARSLRDGREVAVCRVANGDCADGIFSPDGRFVAFTSNFSGREEIYVRPFLSDGAQVQISSAGGTSPYWSADGSEIVYRDPEGWIVSVQVSTAPQLQVQPARRLVLSASHSVLAPFPDHSHFFHADRSVGGATLARAILDWR